MNQVPVGTDSSTIKVAYLCDFTPLDPFSYSGGNGRIYTALKQRFPNICILGQSWGLAEPVRRLLAHTPEWFQLRARWRLHLLLSPLIRRAVERELATGNYDVLFCAYSFHSLFHLRVPQQMVVAYTSDATPTTYRKSEIGAQFGSFVKMSRRLDPLICKAETAVFQSADLLLWPSDWLKHEADLTYGLKDHPSCVVPWGANFPDPGKTVAPLQLSADAPVNLLFVGRDWIPKGGPIAAQTTARLRASGIDARLTVLGCVPPTTDLPDTALTVYPSLDKTVPAELAQFHALYREAHFIVMPSFESYGFAFCEASAFGLPSLCLNVGGVPVTDGVNGHTLSTSATADEFSAVIQNYLNTPDRYAALRQTTRQMYEDQLNWPAWANSAAGLIKQSLEKKRR